MAMIGIDLGTTNSCVSIIEGGQPVVIANSEGKRTTPSIIGFMDNGEKKVGDPAKRQLVTNPHTIYSVKRLMGKQYNDVKHLKFPFEIVEGKGGSASVKIDDKIYTPQEISAIVLQKMKQTAEEYLGKPVTEAVITVPAYFNDQERTATKEAGKIAGLEVKRIINEPTAAALAYGLDKIHEDKKVAVFDLGGGTFDISILELGDGVFEVKSTAGDVSLGGDNFDEKIIDFIVDDFKAEFSFDLRNDKMAFQRVKEAAEKAKIELSSSTQTEINLPYITSIDNQPRHYVKTITRAKFESIIDDLLNKLKQPCLTAIKESGFNVNEIDEVILVGGSTRVPIVQTLVKDIFGKEPSKGVNPDEAVAVGAAIQGGILSGTIEDVLLLDVISISLGIETMGNVMTKLIDANTTIPVSKSQVFSTAADNQPSVEIHVLQGERPLAKDNKTLGRFHLDGLPPAMRGIPQIEVTFDVDSNGILNVSALDKGTGKKQSIRIEGSANLSEAEIEQMRRDAKENEEADKKAKEEIDILNSADSMIFNTEKQIKEFSDKLIDNEKQDLENLVSELKTSHSSKDFDKIKSDIENITSKWNQISTRIYQNTPSEAPNDGSNSTNNNDDAQDVDFEEVK